MCPASHSEITTISAQMAEGKLQEARQSVNRLLERESTHAEAWHIKGMICNRLGESSTAIAAFNTALKYKPHFAEACFDLARALEETGPIGVAIKTYKYLLKIAPAHNEGRARLTTLQGIFQRMLVPFQGGTVYFERGDMENAVLAFRKALAIHPRVPDALANLALALYHLRRYDEAQEAVLEALRLEPGHVMALNTLGNVYQNLEMYEQAMAAYRQAIALKPDYVNARVNLAKVLQKAKDEAGAVIAYEEARRVDPRHAEILTELLHQLRHLCRWDELESIMAQLTDVLTATQQYASPFIIALYADSRLQLENARRWSAQYAGKPYDPKRPLRSGGKLRIGYLSSDFHQHATAYLISELFERHDKNRFELYAYSCGVDDGSAERARIASAVERFRDIRTTDNRSAAELITQDGIDILVDLKGYTRQHRMDLMALRPAPIQMHYLGYPGTTGAPFIDYFIADEIAAPDDALFSERLIRLPHSYQINDRKRPLPLGTPTRKACGLPEKGFVFCDFNNSYKLTPELFDVWMRLLNAVDGSVLWLYERNGESTANLKREAGKRGVDPARIIFAATAPQATHLARYRHVDVFLDSFPVGGHTTASDALWCGVPVVTMAGESFVSRVAASLLHAVELPELVTADLASYEALALALARDPERLRRLRQHLENGRMRFPLFDSIATTRALEAAYLHAVELHRGGQAPQAFAL